MPCHDVSVSTAAVVRPRPPGAPVRPKRQALEITGQSCGLLMTFAETFAESFARL